jgi:hypothetical protein
MVKKAESGPMRVFATGSKRNVETGKLDFEGFLSPLVLERFARYMHHHRRQRDGALRDSDNWQKGMPRDVYMKSAWRHFMAWWMAHRQWQPSTPRQLENALCGVLFNASGYLHEHLAINVMYGHSRGNMLSRLQSLKAEAETHGKPTAYSWSANAQTEQAKISKHRHY